MNSEIESTNMKRLKKQDLERFQQILDTKIFSDEANQLIDKFNEIQPNFKFYITIEWINNRKVNQCKLIRSDWNDVDRNVVNTAWMEFRRTPLFIENIAQTNSQTKRKRIPIPRPQVVNPFLLQSTTNLHQTMNYIKENNIPITLD